MTLQLSREDSQVSFERLLSMSSVADRPPAEGQLHKQLHAASRKIEHLTEVLRESEANSMRLADQAKLLKEEIRRCVLVWRWPDFPSQVLTCTL